MTRLPRSLAAAGLLLALTASAGLAQQTRQLTPIAAPPAAQTAAQTATAPTNDGAMPPQAPALRIDADFHTQVVNRFAQDRNDRVIITASDDKTIRIWAAKDGAPLATLRVPIAPGDEGAIYAVALSPDGNTLLAGGNTGATWDKSYAIYLFDVTTGRLKGRLPDLPAPINDIVYAPDGRSFAMALGNNGGVRVIDATNGNLIASDDSFRQRVTCVAFDAQGRLYATGFDGEVHSYDPAGHRVANRTPVPGAHPYSVAISPDGRTLAVGYADQPRVELLNARDLSHRATLNTDPAGKREIGSAGLLAVAWEPDGSLLAAGSLHDADLRIIVRHWGPGGTGRPVDWLGPRDTVFQIGGTPDGGAILVSADPALIRLDRNGQTVFQKKSPAIQVRDLQDRPMRVSADGMSVRIETKAMSAPWTIDLTQHRVGPPTATRGLTPVPAEPHASILPPQPDLTDWRNSATPKLDGQPLRLSPEELSRSYAASPSGDMVLLGTDYRLRVYRRDGSPLDSVDLPGAVWGVGVSGDGRVAVAAVGDGTLRWFGLSRDGKLTPRISVFLAADGRRWVAWTAAGFFDSSDTGGEGMVGLLLNHARNQAPEWFSFAQVYRQFYAPDTVLARLRGDSATDPSVGLAGVRQTLAQTPPPAIQVHAVCWLSNGGRECKPLATTSVTRSLTVVSADAGVSQADVTVPPEAESLTLQYGLRGEPKTSSAVDVFVNERNAGRAMRDVSADGKTELEQTVALAEGVNRLQLRAYDRSQQTYSESRPIQILRSTPANEQKGKPNLYILSVGINAYDDHHNGEEIPRLGFAVADASAVAHDIKAHAPAAYDRTELIELYDTQATANNVVQALATVAGKATDRDTVLIYLSGHGQPVNQRYYFITQNVHTFNDVETQALSEGALVAALAKIRASNLMLFLDTCHAGAFSLDTASQLAHETGRYILAGAASVEEELDSYDNHNGIFATAILRGLSGQAAPDHKNIDNFELGFFVRPLVAELATEKHHQQSARFKIDADDAHPFPIVSLNP